MLLNYFMQNDDDIDECMYDNEEENDDNFVVEHVHCESCNALFYYLFILSSLMSFCIFYLNNCDV